MTTYYVDATNGDDGALGTSEGTAWKTVAKVNASAFNPGDSILFKRGETWAGTSLVVPSSGSATGGQITIGAYGSGVKPLFDGEDTTNCIVFTGKSYIRLENLECTQGFDFGILVQTASHHIDIVDCDCHDCGNDCINFFTSSYSCTVTGGEFYGAYERAVGPQVSGIEVADGCHDIEIVGAVCHDNETGAGITIHSHVGTTVPYNIVVRDCTLYNQPHFGLLIFKQDDTADSDRNILVDGCEIYNCTLEGIRLTKSAGAANYPNGITFDRCVVRDNTRYGAWLEGDGIVLRRSVIHDGRMLYLRDCVGVGIYNCTFYLSIWGGYACIIINDAGARQDDITIRNCIFASPDTASYMIDVQGVTGVDIDYNLYHQTATLARWRWATILKTWATWLTDSGQDANSPAPANPLFESVPADDFRLQAGSPAINTGMDLGLFYSGAAPDLGAFERWASRGVTWLHLAGVHEEED